MGIALQKLLQAVRLERDAFAWMSVNDRATADALILVLVTRVIILLGFGMRFLGLTTTLNGAQVLIDSLLNALIFWLIYAGLAWAIARYLFDRRGDFATFLRITGFAYPTLLLLIFTFKLGLAPVAALVLGSVWFLGIVTRGIMYETELPVERAGLAAGGALVGWIILALIRKRGLI